MICSHCSEAMEGGLKLRTWKATPMRQAKFFTPFTNTLFRRMPRPINEPSRICCRPKARTAPGTFAVVLPKFNPTSKADSLMDAPVHFFRRNRVGSHGSRLCDPKCERPEAKVIG